MSRKILFHVCCGICFLSYTPLIKDGNVTLFFYNPNVHPQEEYLQRLETTRSIAKKLGLPLIEGRYEPEKWLSLVKGLETEPENGKRCVVCFKDRLEETARVAKNKGFTHFSTTLNISPYKDIITINFMAKTISEKNAVSYLDFYLSKEERFKHLNSARKRKSPVYSS